MSTVAFCDVVSHAAMMGVFALGLVYLILYIVDGGDDDDYKQP